MNEWISLLQTFGLAVTILFFVGACLWRAGGWMGENVVRPIAAKYLQLLDSLIVSIVKQGETLTRVGLVMEKLGSTLDSLGQHTIKSVELLDTIAEAVADLKKIRVGCDNAISEMGAVNDDYQKHLKQEKYPRPK